jgi:hypothetical protein
MALAVETEVLEKKTRTVPVPLYPPQIPKFHMDRLGVECWLYQAGTSYLNHGTEPLQKVYRVIHDLRILMQEVTS